MDSLQPRYVSSSPRLTNDNISLCTIYQSLLAVLKHRTVEKTVEKCELSIVDGDVNHGDSSDEERDTLESQLIVRLHCKHGKSRCCFQAYLGIRIQMLAP